jgi:CMP/dCMP kinase
MAKNFQIAIDGPVSAGKGTISRLVADRLGFLYVDTGAMYRMTALLGIKSKINLDNEKKITELIKNVEMNMRNPNSKEQDGRLTTVILDGEDVSWKIRTEKVGEGASKVAVHKQVRKILVKRQQEIGRKQNVIMEGRDITYVVLPNADLKIYLTASDIIRAKRRHLQLLNKGINNTYEEVYADLIRRDKRDKERDTTPLKIVPDAWVINNSELSINKNVDIIVAKVKALMN